MASDLLSRIGTEIENRLREMRPLVNEYEQLNEAIQSLAGMDGVASKPTPTLTGGKGSRAARGEDGVVVRRSHSASGESPAKRQVKRSVPGAVGQAVLDALDHGSHTVPELVMVSAIDAGKIRASVSRLLKEGAIVKISRDGRTAYARASG